MSVRFSPATRWLVTILAVSLGTPALGEATQPELKVQCQRTADQPSLRITLLNDTPKDVSILIGTSIGNGRWYVAEFLLVEVRRSRDGPIERYLVEGGSPSVAGRLDPWIVALPAGSEFSLNVPMSKLLSKEGKSLSLGAGEIFIRVSVSTDWNERYDSEMVGPGLVKVFTGELLTKWLRAAAECSAG